MHAAGTLLFTPKPHRPGTSAYRLAAERKPVAGGLRPALLAALDGPRHRLRLAHRPATQLHAVEAEDCHAAVPAFNYHFAFTEELRRLRPRQQRQQEQEQGWLQGASHQSARQLLLARRRVDIWVPPRRRRRPVRGWLEGLVKAAAVVQT